MLFTDYTTKLFGFKDTIITNVEQDSDGLHIFLELERSTHTCPNCGTLTSHIHDYRTQIVKDLDIRKQQVFLHLRKRRYYCPCCNKRFYENNSFLMRYQRMTTQLQQYIITCFAELRSASSIAKECHCSVTTAIRYFDRVSYPRPSLPNVIAIDEFKGNSGGHKYQCILADPANKTILDILPCRRQEELFEYFSHYPMEERKKVRYVVMDMSGSFRSTMTACFPNAKVVADKFHVGRLLNWALEHIRKEIQKLFLDCRRKYFKKSRWILLKRNHNLKPEERLQLENMLSVSDELRTAYEIKERFFLLLDLHDKDSFTAKFREWEQFVMAANIEAFNRCLNTVSKWYHPIINACITGYSNGFVEGCNNKTKVLKRCCFGVRNFERFRNRLLYIANS